MNSRAYVAGFNFKGSDQQRKVGALSGGERNRVHLAKLLRSRRQPAAARRAHQRPRRRHAARARGGAARLRRLRRGDLPRPLVPRPRRHPRARLRGRLAGRAGSRATSRPTRSTAASGSAPTPTARTGSRTRSSSAPRRAARRPGGLGHPLGCLELRPVRDVIEGREAARRAGARAIRSAMWAPETGRACPRRSAAARRSVSSARDPALLVVPAIHRCSGSAGATMPLAVVAAHGRHIAALSAATS